MRIPEGIIFDLGNTLIEREYYAPIDGIARILEFSSSEVKKNVSDIQKIADEINDSLDGLRDHYNIEINCQEFHKMLYDKMDILFTINPFQLEIEYHNYSTKYRILDGVLELLEFLKNKNIKLGILSNSIFSRETFTISLKKLKIVKYFSFVITSADYGLRKPHHLLFDMAIEKMNLPREEIWYIGDNPETDIIGAANSNLFSVWFNRQKIKRTLNVNHIEIQNWNELKSIIEPDFI